MKSATQASISIAIGASLGQTFKQTFSAADKQLTKLGNTVKRFDKNVHAIDSFKQSRQATLGAHQAWKRAERHVGELAKAIRQTDKPSKTLQANFRKAKNAARLAKGEFLQARSATRQLGESLRKAGIDTQQLNLAQTKLGTSLAKIKKQQASLAHVVNAKEMNLAKRTNYRSQLFDVVALGGALYGAMRPAVDFELAMAKVGAITNEAANSDGFKALTAQARELGRTTQYTASQAAEAMQYLGMTGMKNQCDIKSNACGPEYGGRG